MASPTRADIEAALDALLVAFEAADVEGMRRGRLKLSGYLAIQRDVVFNNQSGLWSAQRIQDFLGVVDAEIERLRDDAGRTAVGVRGRTNYASFERPS